MTDQDALNRINASHAASCIHALIYPEVSIV